MWMSVQSKHLMAIAFLMLVSALAGCMKPQKFPKRVSVADVVNNVRCELYEAIKENASDYPWVTQFAVKFNMNLLVDRDINASTDTSFVVPIQNGTFTIGLKAGIDTSAASTYDVDFSILDLGNYDDYDCSEIRSRASTPRRLLNGEIGLARWLNEVVPDIERAGIVHKTIGEDRRLIQIRKYAGELDTISYKIVFGITATGSITPSWSLSYPSRRMFNASFTLEKTKMVTHEMVVALTPRVIPEKKPKDESFVLRLIDGKLTKISRRVCVMNAAIVQRREECESEEERSNIRIKSQEKEKIAERRKLINLGRDTYITQESRKLGMLKSEFRIDEKKFESFQELIIADDKKFRSFKEKLKKDPDNGTKVLVFDKRIEDINANIRREKRLVEDAIKIRQEAAKRRASAARLEAERETERRLDDAIQRQVIRDAFRRR